MAAPYRACIRSAHGLRQTKIEHLDPAVRRDFDVCRFQIPMDDTFLMCRFERLTDVLADLEGFFDRNRSALNALRERLALHEFEHEKTRSARLLQIVDCCDIRMIQRSENLGLALEPAHA